MGLIVIIRDSSGADLEVVKSAGDQLARVDRFLGSAEGTKILSYHNKYMFLLAW